jgi:hypothetical protein
LRQANGVDEGIDLNFRLERDERDVVEEGPEIEVQVSNL